jgi:hypothetical protein
MQWFVHRDSQNWGPFPEEVMKEGAASGELHPEDLVWKPGMLDWIRAAEVPDLFISEKKPASQEPDKHVANSGHVAADQSPVQSATTRSNVLLTHWHGDFGLGTAYWVIGALFTALFVAADRVLGDYLKSRDFGAQGTGAIIVFFFALSAIFVVWQTVGIWRSASKHAGRGGKTFWAVTAKLMVILGVLRFGAEFATNGYPTVREGVKLMVGIDDIPAPRIRILRGASELELAGGIPFGTAQKVEDFLQSAPGIKVIHLNSVGGRITEAYKLYRIIREHKLVTFTSSRCLSACTLAFLAGSERYLARGAKLGFHSSSIGGASSGEAVTEINNDVRRTLEAHGASPEFVRRALNTSSTSMWYPTGEELLNAKIIHAVIDGNDFAISGIAEWRDERKLEEDLLSIPIFAVLKEHEKSSYLEIYKAFKDGVQQGISKAELNAQVKTIFARKIVPRYLPRAPDLPVIRYWRSQLSEMRELAKQSYRTCADFAFPELAAAPVNISDKVSPDTLTEDLASLTQLIRSTELTQDQQTSTPQIESDLDFARKKMAEKIPNFQEIVSNPANYRNEPAMLCSSVVYFYSEILSWTDTSRSGAVLRYLMADSN